MRFPSTSGYEGPAMHWIHEQFQGLADVCELVPVPEDIVNDPDSSFRVDDRPYEGRPDVRVVLRGDGAGRSVILNAHADVVPPSSGQERPFDPYVKDGALYGRGSSDDKGQIAVMWTMLTAMKKLGVRPRGDIIFHIVIEEETGGNGTLAFIRSGEKADCCLILDGCANSLLTSARGAVWFTGTVYGRTGHSGSAGTTVNPIRMAVEAMRIIEEYHDDLLAKTHGDDPLFLKYANPMPVTIGQFHSGDWPAMVPQKAVFKGVFGILTTPKEEVMREMVERIRTRGPEWLRDNFEMTFPYRHDTCRTDPNLPFVRTLKSCYEEFGIRSEVAALPASLDLWFYTNLLGVPALSTGCGELALAHTSHEHVVLRDLAVETAVLVRFIEEFCGA